MSWETWRHVVDQAKELDIRRLTLAGFGEPTLHPEVIDFINYAREQLPDKWIQLVTNASLLWQMDLDALANGRLTDIIISFNGHSPESYERLMRGLSFETVRLGLTLLHERLADTDTEIKIRGIRFPPDTEKSRQRTAEFIRSLGFEPRVEEFYPLHNRGGLVFGEYQAPSDDRVCYEFMNTIAIGWNGDVAFCIGDFFHQNVVGNMLEVPIAEIHARCLAERRSKLTQQHFCSRCSIADVFKPAFGNHVG